MWQNIANEDRTRLAVDDKNATRAATNDHLETELLDKYFNNTAYTAPHAVNLAPYESQVHLDPSTAPNPPKTLHWFREQRRWAKVVMGCVQTRFARKTGGGEMGVDGADADTAFFVYCRGDILVMFLWLHWGRGCNVPAHCTTLLEDQSSLDIGASKSGTFDHASFDTSPRHPPLRTRRHVTDSFAGTTSPKKVVEKGVSRIDQHVESALVRLNAITEPLLNFLSPTKAPSLNSCISTEAPAALTESECKAKLMASFAGQVQSLESMKQSVIGELKDKVQAEIDALVKEALQTRARL